MLIDRSINIWVMIRLWLAILLAVQKFFR